MAERQHKKRFFHSLRFKLLLVSLSLLSLPWSGYQYLRETESFLRQARAKLLLETAQSIATLLHNRSDLFGPPVGHKPVGPSLYAHRLETAVHIDGYTEDWVNLLPQARSVSTDAGNENPLVTHASALAFDYLLGADDRNLFLLVRVTDDRLVYQAPGSGDITANDHLRIWLDSPEGEISRYLISTPAPGWVTGVRMPHEWEPDLPSGVENRIKGEWQETKEGYSVEIRLPLSMIGRRFGISVADVDDSNTREITHLLGTPGTGQDAPLATLVTPSKDIDTLIGNLAHEEVRIWVLDKQGRVLAQRGNLKRPVSESLDADAHPQPFNITQTLIRLALQRPTEEFLDEFSNATERRGQEIDAALGATPAIGRRTTPDGKAVIISAAHPVHGSDSVLGAVLVEQTTNAILSLQNRALEHLFGTVLLAVGGTSLLLLGFSSLLTGRILRLRNRIESAVSEEGRIRMSPISTEARDEFGDLERSFSSVLNRLHEYNRYLEAVASRLAHEMRTPLTMVAGSLENLGAVITSPEQRTYVTRASHGVERLSTILNQMREATRLEQALQRMEKETFDLTSFLKLACTNYRAIYPQVSFGLTLPDSALPVHGAAELIIQALDKLVSNAVDFHQPDTPIDFQLTLEDKRTAVLTVTNLGPRLPVTMSGELFGSMVSIRPGTGDEPHLGLGLYLVQIICEYHGGRAIAKNLEDGRGVRFSLCLPLV